MMEERRGAEEAEQYQAVRRGWCLGGARFREGLLEQMAGGMGEHHGGEERQEAAVAVAERIAGRADAVLGLSWACCAIDAGRAGRSGG